MCGIYGTTFHYKDEIVKKKLTTMRFRGPDFQSFSRYNMPKDKQITLGHVRLSIIDLDARSNQPFDYNENISIVFNGEIYNFEELKCTYLKDIPLRTTSDTEVICALYEKMGRNCLHLLNGMFSFVILDKSRNELFGVRDRLGKKPFYYRWNNDGFEFSSQPEPIHIGNKFNIDEEARAFYLFNGYIPDPYCIWKEIKKLRAGQYFVYSIAENKLYIDTYWDLFTNSCNFSKPKSYEEAKDTVKMILEDAVKLRLRADVPIGMFLSGGIDSSLTSALVAKNKRDITAYSIGFDNPEVDESTHAREVATSLGIPFKVNKCEGNDMIEVFNNLYRFYDEPFADFSAIPTSLLAKVTRQDVTVAIGGDGGDEIFYGYSSYFKLAQKEKIYNIMPFALRKGIYNIVHQFCDNSKIELLKYKDLKEQAICSGNYGFFYKSANYDPISLGYKLPDIEYIKKERGLLAFSDYDMKHYMNSCINTKTDRASMRFSLELRSPLMDYRLAEYSRLLPIEYMRNNELGGKRILKDILYEMVPREILDRPKQGFGAPVGDWFKTILKDEFTDTVNLENVKKYIPELKAEKFIEYRDKFLAGNKSLQHTSFLKVYNYIKWIEYYC